MEPAMTIPLEVSFTGLPHDDSIEELVIEKVRHLEKVHAGIMNCRVAITAPHKRHRKGNLPEVSIELHLPGGELAVRQRQTDVGEHEHAEVAVRDGFAAMARKLNAWKQRRRHDVKHHEGMLQGRIDSIDHARDFGQILATDHRLIYFHRNSVVDGDFDDLAKGDKVELVVQIDESEIGPQASTVRPIGSLRYHSA